MSEIEWLACDDPREMLGVLWDKVSNRKLRLFAVACCLSSRPIRLKKEFRHALEISTRFADGQATEDELRAVYQSSNDFACGLYHRSETERQIRRWAEATAVANATAITTPVYHMAGYADDAVWMIHRAAHRNPNKRLAELLRDVSGPLPFRSVATDHSWLTKTVRSLAHAIYDDRAFDHLPILADALEEAGCDNADILSHCRQPGEHVLGCWVVDLILDKQ